MHPFLYDLHRQAAFFHGIEWNVFNAVIGVCC
jgi:hypothetical protein